MKKIKLNIILAIILLIILIFRISTKDGTQDFIFSTTDVVNGDIVESVVSSGKIIPGEEIKVFSRVTGDIYQTYVEYGDIVKKGQILIELDSSTYENNLNTKLKNLEILEIEQDQMRKKVDTDTKLLDGGYIPKVELEESENQYRIKSIEIDELNSEINLLKQKISDTKLTSPIDGRIDYLNEDLIKEGKIFNASWVYTISSGYKDLNISLSIDGREITKVDLGQEVEFSVENMQSYAWLIPEDVISASIELSATTPLVSWEERLRDGWIISTDGSISKMSGKQLSGDVAGYLLVAAVAISVPGVILGLIYMSSDTLQNKYLGWRKRRRQGKNQKLGKKFKKWNLTI